MMAKFDISIIGLGYVGLVTGSTFAKKGFSVICADVIEDKVTTLRSGRSPIYEPGLEEIIQETVGDGKLSATTSTPEAVLNSDISFICVGTPSGPDGAVDLKYISGAAEDIGAALKQKEDYHLVVVKSTVVPLTTEETIIPIIEQHSGKKAGEGFGICMNPEFLREGNAVFDSLNPDRIVIGELDKKSGDTLIKYYDGFEVQKFRTGLRTAEMIKYAANAFLATKITYANEMANICTKLGIDVYEVMNGVGTDSRINPEFLNAGCGFGGSCFPKDLQALKAVAEAKGYEPLLLNSVLLLNDNQYFKLIEMAELMIGELQNKRVAVLGLSFKPNTDDVRETRALPLIKSLLEKGAVVVAYDPKGIENFKELIGDWFIKMGFSVTRLIYADKIESALRNADACIIQSDWDEFKDLGMDEFKLMKKPAVIDGRRTFNDPTKLIECGLKYKGIGWRD
jgi:UDPglucose 6-dehydrogenase